MMNKSLTIDVFKTMFSSALDAVTANKDELSALDSATGDGDHGTAICQAMEAMNRTLQEGSELKAVLNDMGFAAMMESCGSTSTLFGSLLLGMSESAEGTELTAEEVAAMFAAGLANVQQQTKAAVGDKTMMDALIPAVDAMQEHQSEGLVEMFQAAALAAEKGRDATKDMIAKFGRARNLGERVIGHLDAGAASMAIIFKAFSGAASAQS